MGGESGRLREGVDTSPATEEDQLDGSAKLVVRFGGGDGDGECFHEGLMMLLISIDFGLRAGF